MLQRGYTRPTVSHRAAAAAAAAAWSSDLLSSSNAATPGAQADVNLDTCVSKINKYLKKMLLVTGATSFYTGIAVFFPYALLRFSISKITFFTLSKSRLLVGSMDL